MFTTPDFNKHTRHLKPNQTPCVICGKGIDEDKITHGLHESGLGVFVKADGSEPVEPAAEMGFQPIGPECRRKYKLELAGYVLGPGMEIRAHD